MHLAGHNEPGQTEILSRLTKSENVAMMLIAGKFRICLATVHLPLRQVYKEVKRAVVIKKLKILQDSMKKEFLIPRPKIAVLGLNPHAGENGALGKEEKTEIRPAISKAKKLGIDASGPFPADGFFGAGLQKEYDTILAMYHDQGLIPLKMSGFEIGVNYSAGLRIVRTSPDHGTAFDLAGKGTASHRSMMEAIKLAVSVSRNRWTSP
jgi:4-hydroxythreonine-4-phosphate dehydrogenase